MATTDLTIRKQVSAALDTAHAIKIETPRDLEAATETLSLLNKTADELKKTKDAVMRPLLDAAAAERARWAPYEKPLEAAIASVRTEMSRYQTQAIRAEQDAKDAIAARVGEGRGHLRPETAMERIDQIEAPIAKVETQEGSLKFRSQQQFAIEDITKLPAEYLLPNEPLIRKAMKLGTPIDGVRYYVEQVPVNTR